MESLHYAQKFSNYSPRFQLFLNINNKKLLKTFQNCSKKQLAFITNSQKTIFNKKIDSFLIRKMISVLKNRKKKKIQD